MFAVHCVVVRFWLFWLFWLLLLLLLLMSYTKLQYFTSLHFPDLPFFRSMFPLLRYLLGVSSVAETGPSFDETLKRNTVAPHLSGTVPVAAALYTQAAERPRSSTEGFHKGFQTKPWGLKRGT